MGNVATHPKNNISIGDLSSKYQNKINNYNFMINSMNDIQKQLFQIAINVYDIQKRQDQWDMYVGYALKTLAMNGYYYDIPNQKWQTCMPKDSFVNPYQDTEDIEEAYRRYLRSLYPGEVCSEIGISRWDILDANVNETLIAKAKGGEMSYEYFDLEFNLDNLDVVGGEQDATKNKIVIPTIPISPNIDIKEMTKGDNSKDKFIYAYTDSGVSKNKRDWRPMIMDRIAQQVMEYCPPGNLGHVKPKNAGYELPLPVVTWIGATTELLADGKTKRLWLKGYVIPVDQGTQLKTFIKAKAINSISVYGGLTLLPNEETGIQSVLDCDLKSIDISGKLKEGLNSGIVALAGEMHDTSKKQTTQTNNKVNQKEAETMSFRDATLEQIKSQNPKLYGEMKAEIISGLETEEKNKVIMAKAGEMDTLTEAFGDDIKGTMETYKSFAGEMAEALGMDATKVSTSDIVSKVKENIEKISAVAEAIKPAEGQDVVAKAQELAKESQIIANTKAIENVKSKFDTLTSGIKNEAVKNLVQMHFDGVLNVNADSIGADYEATSIAKLEAEVPTVIQSVTEQAQALMQTGHAAGEMALMDNLGVGAGASSKSKSVEDMTDEEYARSLGYGN